ncbi:hypothetical protein [Oscillibacter sp.]|uniref:hypothetical protein n=1 Tax=Oscillibacter sp. TaxID=1945593 RepID=UPI00289D6E98|nr:hypothetical protein [Oscillibacter sp.]
MSKYKFSLTPKIKGIVEWQLQHYNDDKRQIEQLKNDMVPSPTAGYSLTGGVSGGGTSRTTENVAVRISTNPYIMQTERSCKAIERVLSRCNETDSKLVDLVYWRQSYTVEGAGMKIGLSKSAAYQRINSILGAIALEIGYVNM